MSHSCWRGRVSLTSTLPLTPTTEFSFYSHEIHQVIMSGAQEWFSAEIGDVLGGWYVDDLNITFLYSLADIMMAYVDVFCSGVPFRRLGKCN